MHIFSMLLVAFACFSTVDDLPSGPDAGLRIAKLPVVVAVGEKQGESIDATTERGDKPTLYILVRGDQWDRPMSRVLKALDDALAAGVDGAKDAEIVAVWITDTPEQSREYLPLAQQSLQLKQTRWTVSEAGTNGPDGWALNDAAGLTVVVARGGKVVKSFGFSSWNERDARTILSSLRST